MIFTGPVTYIRQIPHAHVITFTCNTFVIIPYTVSAAAEHSTDTSGKSFSPSIGYHYCIDNKPEFKDLIKYSKKIAVHGKEIAVHWKEIAVSLNIPYHRIEVIDFDNRDVEQKYDAIFNTWLQSTATPCWCHFIQALYAVGLYRVAEEAKIHLEFIESSGVDKYGGNAEVVCT